MIRVGPVVIGCAASEAGVRRTEVSAMKCKAVRFAVAAIALSGLFAACGDDNDADEFPVGVYHQPGSTDAEGTMEFTSDGTFVLTGSDGLVFTEGTYSVDGDRFTWETDSYCKGVGEDAESASYSWSLDGDLLTMTPDGEDLCSDRMALAQDGFEKSDG
jgi:hypothetical protein